MTRLTLAATLAANYGIYGPAFELLEHEPREPGSEEYLQLGEVRDPQLGSRPSGQPAATFIARVNRIRRENPALHEDWRLAFHADRQRPAHLLFEIDRPTCRTSYW